MSPPLATITKVTAKVEAAINSVADDLVSHVERLGGAAIYLNELHLLTINQKLTIAITVAFSGSEGTNRVRRWQLRKFRYTKADISLVLKMDVSNTKIDAYYALPTAHLGSKINCKLRVTSRVFAEKYRHDSLGAFYRMWTRNGELSQRV